MKVLYNFIKTVGFLVIFIFILAVFTHFFIDYIIGLHSEDALGYLVIAVPSIWIIVISFYVIPILFVTSFLWLLIKFKAFKNYIKENWQIYSLKNKLVDTICLVAYILTFLILLLIIKIGIKFN